MIDTIVLGLVQGLTEFLPVSSSGHLILVHHLLGFSSVDPAFDVFVQGGTVLSVLLYFRGVYRNLTKQYLIYLVVATVPAVLAGLFLKDYIDVLFTSLWGVAIGFALTTVFLLLSKRPIMDKALTMKNTFLIGLSQAFAILPGLSRSGSTIGTALLLGISPAEAFNFSFLMSIPVISGATLLSVRHLSWSSGMADSYMIGFFVAFVMGYISLVLLARIVKKGQFYRFAPYTALLCLLSLYLASRL